MATAMSCYDRESLAKCFTPVWKLYLLFGRNTPASVSCLVHGRMRQFVLEGAYRGAIYGLHCAGRAKVSGPSPRGQDDSK